MRERIWLLLQRLWRRPGIRISLFGLLALLVAVIAPTTDRSIPEEWVTRFSRDAVLPILNILASSMLAVTTFSLGIMVSAFRSAAGEATPRVYRILMRDMTTLNVLSVFVGAFLFSLSAIVMFRAGFYSESASVIVFALTVLCIVMIIVAILRWIAHLSQLGSLDHTLGMVEEAATKPLRQLVEKPNLGALPAADAPRIPDDAIAINAPVSGYVQFISLAELNTFLAENDAKLWVTGHPGGWVLKNTAIAYVDKEVDAERIAENFTFGDERTFEQDARFGVVILSEIASRALSPGVNDPGTAIDVVHRVERVFWDLGCRMSAQKERNKPDYDRIIIGQVSASNLMQDGFAALMPDGGDRFDVMAQVLKATNRLSKSDWADLADAAAKTRDGAVDIIERRIDDPDAVKALRAKVKR